MSRYVEVAGVGDLTDGTMKKATVEGRDLLLVRVDGRYYATNHSCPHMGGLLSLGRLDGTIVTCPRHGSQFDVTSGRVIRWTHWTGIVLILAKMYKRPRPLKTYPTQTEGDRVLVDMG